MSRTAPPPAGADAVLATIAQTFAITGASRLPKHARLYDAVVTSIDCGTFRDGDKLPGERELCAATGISLGTVQKALGLLAGDGRIVREHGRGTYIRRGRRSMTELWHYRFRDPVTRKLLPVYARVQCRERVGPGQPWNLALGLDAAGYVRIGRVITIGDALRCWSDMYLPAGRFGRMLDLPLSDLASVNLKQILATKFNAPTLATTQTVLVRPFPAAVRKAIDARPRAVGLLLQIVATTRQAEPISYQRIYVPQSDFELEVGAETIQHAIAAAA